MACRRILCLPVYVQASLCEQVPDCAALGFSLTSEDGCADNGYLICPFDSNYKKCATHSCEKMGFTADDKSSWCENIITCENNDTYTACVGEKQCPKSNEELTATCGTSGAKGWEIKTSIHIGCKYCFALSCPEGSSTNPEIPASCYGTTLKGYSGNAPCYTLTQCAYDCSGVGGERCSSSSTYLGRSCTSCGTGTGGGGGNGNFNEFITEAGGIQGETGYVTQM